MARQRPLHSYQLKTVATSADRMQEQAAATASPAEVAATLPQPLSDRPAGEPALPQDVSQTNAAADETSGVRQQSARGMQEDAQLQSQQTSVIPATEASHVLIVARSMTRTQAAELKESLSNQTSVARAMLYAQPGGAERSDKRMSEPVSYYWALNASIGRDPAVPKAIEAGGDRVNRSRVPARREAQADPTASSTTEPAVAVEDAVGAESTSAGPEPTDVVIVVKDLPPDPSPQRMQPEASGLDAERSVGTVSVAAPTTAPVPAAPTAATLPAELNDAAP
jgi:hypothetical protein